MTKTIYALGFFDGVHIGHGALLRRCRELAQAYGCKAGVVTFGTHPEAQVLGKSPALISSTRDREWLMKEHYHMDTVITLPFDREMRTKPWEDFLKLLRTDYGAAGFVCGEDYRFGNRGQGNARLLSDYCAEQGIPCAVVPDQMIDGIRVSSTFIRGKIEAGEMETAVRFLGHPHILTEAVARIDVSELEPGISSALLRLPEGLAVPQDGSYACRVKVAGRACPAVAHVEALTNAAQEGIALLLRLPEDAGDLCGREIRLEFYRPLELEEIDSYLQTTFTE